jgi:hypothetical protein
VGRIIFRGTRDTPRVYADYYDYDGTRRTRLLRGARTKAEARALLAQIELRVGAGKPGLGDDEPRPAGPVLVGELMRRWLDGLENRNALLDRQRAENT